MVLPILWNILAPVFLIMATGFAAMRQWCLDLRTLSILAFYVFIPCLVFTSLLRLQLDFRAIGQICTLNMGMLAGLTALGCLLAWTQAWDKPLRSAFLLATLFQNAGNYAIPVSRFAFGDTALDIVVLYHALLHITANTLGVVIVSSGVTTLRKALGSLARVPLLYATLLAIIVRHFSLTLPLPLLRGMELCAQASVPLLLLILGMQLAQLETHFEYGPTALATGVRLVVSPLMALALAEILGMQGVTRAASVLAWSVPTAVITGVLALQYECRPGYVASVILVTTLLSVLSIPVLLSWLM